MGRLTSEERRRVFLARERTCQIMLARISAAPAVDIDDGGASRLRLQRLLKTVLILTLFTGGLALYEFVEFHPPASLVEALLQRQ
jgi:hypothetical protein